MKKISMFLLMAVTCGASVANEGTHCATKLWGGESCPTLAMRLSRDLGHPHDFGGIPEMGPMKSITISVENRASKASLIFAHDINSVYTADTNGFKFAPGCSETVTFHEGQRTGRIYQVKVQGLKEGTDERCVFGGTSASHRFDLKEGAVCAHMTHQTVAENEYTLSVVLEDCKSDERNEL